MTRVLSFLFILIFLSTQMFSQQNPGNLKSINNKFQSFDYPSVVEKADSLLSSTHALNDSEKVEIYRLKGISHYSLLQMRSAFSSFMNVLKLDSDYKMDPIQNSPKIVKYYDEIKENFKNIIVNAEEKEIEFNNELINQRSNINTAITYSLMLPGAGQLHYEETIKGWSLISATIVTLGSSFYFIIDANKKENDYLNESDKSQIEIKYKRYNESYKYRNISLISFAAVWLYAQIDLLFLSNNEIDLLEVQPSVLSSGEPQFKINIRF